MSDNRARREYWECPECGWDSSTKDTTAIDTVFIDRKDMRRTPCCRTWTDVFKCPECATVFEVEDGD